LGQGQKVPAMQAQGAHLAAHPEALEAHLEALEAHPADH
jgi:hypothetical protein